MGKWPADRLAASSGFVFLILYVAAMFVVPKPPSLSSPNAKVAAYYIQHHRGGLVQTVLLGLSAIAFLWFIGSLAALIRDAGEMRLASVAFAGGIATVGLGFLGTTIDAALFERVALESPSMAGGLHVISVTAFTVIGFATATIAFATALAVWRTKVLPAWYADDHRDRRGRLRLRRRRPHVLRLLLAAGHVLVDRDRRVPGLDPRHDRRARPACGGGSGGAAGGDGAVGQPSRAGRDHRAVGGAALRLGS